MQGPWIGNSEVWGLRPVGTSVGRDLRPRPDLLGHPDYMIIELPVDRVRRIIRPVAGFGAGAVDRPSLDLIP